MSLPKRPDPINGSASSVAAACCCSWNFKGIRNHQEGKLYIKVFLEQQYIKDVMNLILITHLVDYNRCISHNIKIIIDDVYWRKSQNNLNQRKKLQYKTFRLTASGSISDGDSNLSKQCPDIVQTKSSLVGSITTSLHVSSQTRKENKLK